MEAANSTVEKPKLIDQLNDAKGTPWISFEFFPPKTPAGVESLFHVISKLKVYKPLFVDFTWGAGGSTSDLTLDLCTRAITENGLNPNMHLTCTGLDLSHLDEILSKTRKAGIRNILALRGDPPLGHETWVMPENGLTSALELIKHIKNSSHGGYFCVGAACYPEGHPNKMTVIPADELHNLTDTENSRCSCHLDTTTNESIHMVCKDTEYEIELNYLKQKVDAGASFLITQMFFDVTVFDYFVTRCRSMGITAPIIPGIMLIGSYPGFKRMTKLCKTKVPLELEKSLEEIKDDEMKIKEFGIQYATQMIRQLLSIGVIGIHFYTLNSSHQPISILESLRDVLPNLPPITTTDLSTN